MPYYNSTRLAKQPYLETAGCSNGFQTKSRSPPSLNISIEFAFSSLQAFSSTYEIESKFTSSDWQTRLSRPNIHTFVAVDLADQHKNEADWIGSVTLLGPTEKEAFEISDVQGLGSGTESRWQMNSLYVHPKARGRGVAKELVVAALRFAGSEGPARVRIMIKRDHQEVRVLYEGLGFEEVGRCTLGEALRANGDGNLIPEGEGETARFNTKGGLVMEFLGEVNLGNERNP
ncbi:hypothetical protein PRZ48_011704 [Zasmidium cellare]|uniref:N-acetyltransferase domain-containing protein n=1 Tax=Zasmidium cellare TaxID=395010 RepID=A0ABR0E743_ZASCE|nr:hypothetical protein PRZ48_011704 [Zasmidium cellare]